MDPAAGLHVRMRLGGSTWPPLVFYRICTHRPVADINAFAPRDYARERQEEAERQTRAMAAVVEVLKVEGELRRYIKPDGTVGYRDVTVRRSSTRPAPSPSPAAGLTPLLSPVWQGWYQRVENNPWRPIADHQLYDDPDVNRPERPKINYAPLRSMRK